MTQPQPTANPQARPPVPGSIRTERAPAGCFCGLMHSSLACLTCTCPDCGAFGRYGIPFAHTAACG